ncbi:MAG: type II toxin-antitoxin system VapC family toxin [Oscillospiraceae bacterium]|jgi:PIN domain nuclease of toxin-antitoxin system|nr:type II toxin-antitoxin system VapC family toxin [Oscillospiraceae bacterium]
MRYLIDTHVALWILKGEPISDKAKAIIDDVSTEVFVSIATAWEIALKVGLGKLKYDGGVRDFLDDVRLNDFQLLGVEESHIEQIEALPYHHRDPFDRLLIATAIAEDMTFLSADENVPMYDVKWLW